MSVPARPGSIIALVLTTLSSSVHGDVVDAVYVSKDEFHYGISQMPDFDMIRENGFLGPNFVEGVPFGGTGHDFPACMMNLCAYAANHGFRELQPGPGNWELASKYAAATSAIEAFGNAAQTNENGTPYQWGVAAAQAWLNVYGGKLIVESKKIAAYQAPTLATAALKAASGAIVAISYGKYPLVSAPGVEPIVVGPRAGGLWIVPTRLDRGPGPVPLIKYRTPFTSTSEYGESPLAQSPFSSTMVLSPVEKPVLRLGYFQPIPMTVLGDSFDGVNHYKDLIDAIVAIRPRATYSWQEALPAPTVNWHSSATLDELYRNNVQYQPPLGPGTTLRHAALLFGNVLAAVTSSAAGGFKLQCLDLNDNSVKFIDNVAANSRLTTAPDGHVYVLGGGVLRKYDFDAVPPLVDERVMSTYYDLAYDDNLDRVVLYAPALRLLSRVKPDLSDDVFFIMPTSVPTASTGEVATGPTGSMWVHPGTINALYEAKPVEGSTTPAIEPLSFPSMLGFTDFDVDDNNRAFVTVGGTLKEFWFDPVDLRWEAAIDSPSGLNGSTCLGRMALAKTRNGFDASMSGPEWRTLGGDEMLAAPSSMDCPGDLYADGEVNAADLSVLLSAWGPAQGNIADLDQDGVVNAADLAVVLASWGPCPQQ
ncbi:MAG: dockerin type I repeat-containing protein [Phycisphaerales bacterium]